MYALPGKSHLNWYFKRGGVSVCVNVRGCVRVDDARG